METLEAIYWSWLEPYKFWCGRYGEASVHMQPNNKHQLYGVWSLYIQKVPLGWVIEFYSKDGGVPGTSFPQHYVSHEEARRAALRWLFQGVWDPI